MRTTIPIPMACPPLIFLFPLLWIALIFPLSRFRLRSCFRPYRDLAFLSLVLFCLSCFCNLKSVLLLCLEITTVCDCFFSSITAANPCPIAISSIHVWLLRPIFIDCYLDFCGVTYKPILTVSMRASWFSTQMTKFHPLICCLLV